MSRARAALLRCCAVIALIRGALVQIGDDHVVVDTGGVGYEVFCHLRTIATLHTSHEPEVTLHVHTSVGADAIRLYGFVTPEELRLFRLLIGVERIGPKAALGILGSRRAAHAGAGDRRGRHRARGDGPGHRAQDRRAGDPRAPRQGRIVRAAGDAASRSKHGENQAVAAAIAGLVGLGFRESEARNAVAAIAVDGDGHDVADLVGAALRRLDTAGSAR